MGVYPGSTAQFCSGTGFQPWSGNSSIGVVFRGLCSRNGAVMNIRSGQSPGSSWLYQRLNENAAEYTLKATLAPGSASTSRRINITVCGNRRGFMYAFPLLDNLQSDVLQNLVLRCVSFCAIYIQQSAAWLAKRYCSLLPTKMLLLYSVSDGLSPSSNYQLAIFILTAMSTPRTPCSSSRFWLA